MRLAMEIRPLYGNEVQMAVCTAHEIFERCVRAYTTSPKEAEQFYSYVDTKNLWQEMQEGRLFLWGAFDAGGMCAVSAMQSVGHITMLYVRPQCMGQQIGTQMLNYMFGYAANILHKDRVTINVMPIAAAGYFYKRGFELIPNVTLNGIYVSLERRLYPMYGGLQPNIGYVQVKHPEVVYEKKQVQPKYIAMLMGGALLFSFAVMVGATICHMAGGFGSLSVLSIMYQMLGF